MRVCKSRNLIIGPTQRENVTKQLAAEDATDLDLDDKAALGEFQAELDEATDKVEAGEAALSPQRKRGR